MFRFKHILIFVFAFLISVPAFAKWHAPDDDPYNANASLPQWAHFHPWGTDRGEFCYDSDNRCSKDGVSVFWSGIKADIGGTMVIQYVFSDDTNGLIGITITYDDVPTVASWKYVEKELTAAYGKQIATSQSEWKNIPILKHVEAYAIHDNKHVLVLHALIKVSGSQQYMQFVTIVQRSKLQEFGKEMAEDVPMDGDGSDGDSSPRL
jgi:hypothetical protein